VGDSGGVVILVTNENILDVPDGRRLEKALLVGDFGIGVLGLEYDP
jgi:hypothetical protein